MSTLLLDASVILAAFDPEDIHHDASRAILRDPEATLATLDLARYEVANVAVRSWRAPDRVAELLSAIDAIADDGGALESTSALLTSASGIAEQHVISVYDATYVAASRQGDRVLVSCDARDLLSKGLAVAPGAVGKRRTGLFGLGSNVGDRRAHLQAAVGALSSIGVRVLAASSVYDTDPVGEVLDQPSFLNACVLVETGLEPLELLDAVKRLEAELGRERGGARHGPRAIDIDILLLGGLVLAHERMTLPHEQLLNRRFVLIPALELDFELTAPDGNRLSDALAALPVSEGVRWAGPPLTVPEAR
ncbi:MAG TPA: 2-amino-4-hydroxy-6-hydroxymethyldihydropteridine diphosphokinase [Solirubrobacteraceae bacterium]